MNMQLVFSFPALSSTIFAVSTYCTKRDDALFGDLFLAPLGGGDHHWGCASTKVNLYVIRISPRNIANTRVGCVSGAFLGTSKPIISCIRSLHGPLFTADSLYLGRWLT